MLSVFGARETGRKRGTAGERRRPWAGRRCSVAVVGRGRPRGHPAAAACVEAARQGKKCFRVSKGCWPQEGFIPPKAAGGRRIQVTGIGRLWMAAATGGCWATFWPRRAACAGCFGSPPVGFRAAGPGGMEKKAVGLFWLAG
jgi:hypothetical protein